jgi:poly(3-hydroxybutyrate) depolymerase
MRWVYGLLALLLAAVLGACAAPAAHDERVPVGDGFAQVHVPAGHSRTGVVVLHSLWHTYSEPIAQGWSKLSDKKDFVAIYPDRPMASWNAGLCCGGAAAAGRDDVSWLTNVITTMRLKYGLDRIYLVGNSNGGMMVERYAVEQPWMTSHIAVWAGAPEMLRSGRWTGSAAIFDGVNDRVVPWNGGTASIAGVSVKIRAANTTGDWLIGAHLKGVRVKGAGHAPPKNWPALAWAQLSR